MGTFISHSPGQTAALGEQWGRDATQGLVIGLCGDLGAGKTELVKGLACGLGIPARVHSPTFALVNIYTGGRLPLFHLDLYRLENREQIHAAGLDEYLHPAGVTVIEWAERWFGAEADAVRERAARVGGAGNPPAERDESRPRDGTKQTRTDGNSENAESQHLRWVQIDTTSVTERLISYEDFGA